MAKKDKRRLVERVYEALNDLVAKQIVAVDFVRFDRIGDTIVSQGTKDALNRSDTIKTYVKATHWIDSFWYYVNVRIKKDEDGQNELPFVSVSFFQDIDGVLNQLFRAEWDNFKQSIHPQPHWHLSNLTDDSFEDLAQKEELNKDNPFAELIENSPRVDIPKMHFAMAGNWHEAQKEMMVVEYSDEKQLAQWLVNLFDHVREQLVYAKS